MSTPLGTFEHANHAVPRVEHGYCTDDVARVLLATAREPVWDQDIAFLARTSIRFLEAAQSPNGLFRNRRRSSGSWHGPSTSDDWWGRALWALGTTMARTSDGEIRDAAVRMFARGAQARSMWPRSMAFAVFGCAEVLGVEPANEGARRLIDHAVSVLDRPEQGNAWRWSEERLTYANAALPEAMMAAGTIVGNDQLVRTGLRQLRWLLGAETRRGHLSVTPTCGRGPESDGPIFDQQPIEVAAMSDACVRAFELTSDSDWLLGHELAVQWFTGHNDAAAPMYDPLTGGGYDGLTANGPNLNQGAESSIALLTTLQHARRFERADS